LPSTTWQLVAWCVTLAVLVPGRQFREDIFLSLGRFALDRYGVPLLVRRFHGLAQAGQPSLTAQSSSRQAMAVVMPCGWAM
jgi:hypothetical protein